MEKGNRTFGLAGWKAQDLPKHDIRPIFSNNEKNGKSFGRLQASALRGFLCKVGEFPDRKHTFCNYHTVCQADRDYGSNVSLYLEGRRLPSPTRINLEEP
jgi:hypothetical protein